LTRRLGFKNLWVDAICIIQDSEADKIAEINAMGEIYANSALTILAGSAASSKDGFVGEAPLPPLLSENGEFSCMIPFKFPDEQIKALHLTRNEIDIPGGYDLDPLSSRAWTLQEWLLSTRKLSFSNLGVYWDCLSKFTDLLAPHEEGDGWVPRLRMPSQFHHDDNDPEKLSWQEESRDPGRFWIELIEEYSRRKLSVLEDRLPAISGLAAEVQVWVKNSKAYRAGLWEEHLIEHLGWCLEGQASRTKKLDGPSWSWVSVLASVGFDPIRYSSALLIKCSTTLVSENAPLGPVSGGRLVLQAYLARPPPMTIDDIRSTYPAATHQFDIDYAEDPSDTTKIPYAFLLLGLTGLKQIVGLLLRRLEDQEDEIYMRVGLITVYDEKDKTANA